MTRGNATKARLLGMPYGTACNQLRKKILFRVLCGRILSRDCFRCGQPIESVEELSVEHKVPWQSAADPVASFFDLDNIAFSHLRCDSWAPNGGKTHCSNGHPLIEQNIYRRSCGRRTCRECDREKWRRRSRNPAWREKRKVRRRKSNMLPVPVSGLLNRSH